MPEESTKENAMELNWSNVDPPKRAKGNTNKSTITPKYTQLCVQVINTSFKCKKCYIHILALIVTN